MGSSLYCLAVLLWLAALLGPPPAAAQPGAAAAEAPSPAPSTVPPSDLLPSAAAAAAAAAPPSQQPEPQSASPGPGGTPPPSDTTPSPSPISSLEPGPGCEVTNTTQGDLCSLLYFKSGLTNSTSLESTWYPARVGAPCSFLGVRCYPGTSRVEGLTLTKLDLAGTIPSDWVAPRTLFSLVLSYNRFSGTLSPGWVLPTDTLVYVDLAYNEFGGPPIPLGWSSLQALRILTLANNDFTGALPAPALLPPALSQLDLSHNRLSGMPAGWELLQSLTKLDLSNNVIESAVPAVFALPPSLTEVDVSHNRLFGSLNNSVQQLHGGISRFRISHNNFSGPIPTWFVAPGSIITILELDNNEFTGTLPEELIMPKLNSASLYGNQLTGTLPTMWDVPATAEIRIVPQTGTQLCGTVPATPQWFDMSTGNQLQPGSQLDCGQSPSPAPSPSPPPSPVPSPSPSPLPPPSPSPDSGSSSNTAAIAGGVAGGVAACVVLPLALWYFLRKRRQRQTTAGLGCTEAGKAGAQPSADAPAPFNDPFLALAIKSKGDQSPDASGSSELGSMMMGPDGGSLLGAPAPSIASSAGGSMAGVDINQWTIAFEALEIQRQIGEGSFGRVYLAKWQHTPVAVKVLLGMRQPAGGAAGPEPSLIDSAKAAALTFSSPVLKNLHQEAALMAKLRHPNVVSFLGVCPSPPAVVTEFCSKGSLADVLSAGLASPTAAARLDWPRRLTMLLDTAKGMLHLHSHSPPIVHRDLKSPNLLVDAHWRVKISDFNLSRLLEESAVMSSIAISNPRWLSPEILSGKPATVASDVFSFAIVMWELLVWEIPWCNENPWQVVTTIQSGGRLPIPPAALLPGPGQPEEGLREYVVLMERCWAQAPEERPPFSNIIVSIREMLEAAMRRHNPAAVKAAAAKQQQQQQSQPPGGQQEEQEPQ